MFWFRKELKWEYAFSRSSIWSVITPSWWTLPCSWWSQKLWRKVWIMRAKIRWTLPCWCFLKLWWKGWIVRAKSRWTLPCSRCPIFYQIELRIGKNVDDYKIAIRILKNYGFCHQIPPQINLNQCQRFFRLSRISPVSVILRVPLCPKYLIFLKRPWQQIELCPKNLGFCHKVN